MHNLKYRDTLKKNFHIGKKWSKTKRTGVHISYLYSHNTSTNKIYQLDQNQVSCQLKQVRLF